MRENAVLECERAVTAHRIVNGESGERLARYEKAVAVALRGDEHEIRRGARNRRSERAAERHVPLTVHHLALAKIFDGARRLLRRVGSHRLAARRIR